MNYFGVPSSISKRHFNSVSSKSTSTTFQVTHVLSWHAGATISHENHVNPFPPLICCVFTMEFEVVKSPMDSNQWCEIWRPVKHSDLLKPPPVSPTKVSIGKNFVILGWKWPSQLRYTISRTWVSWACDQCLRWFPAINPLDAAFGRWDMQNDWMTGYRRIKIC